MLESITTWNGAVPARSSGGEVKEQLHHPVSPLSVEAREISLVVAMAWASCGTFQEADAGEVSLGCSSELG